MTAKYSAKTIVLVLTPMLTGAVSFVATLAVIVSIRRSQVKLSTTYRRLVFSISIYCLVNALGQLVSSVPMPVGTPHSWLASGNDTTCAMQSFANLFGFTGTIFYSLSLTIYFLLVVKYNVDDEKITKYAEPFLHAVPIAYSSVVSTFVLATKNYGVDHEVGKCAVISRPFHCYEDPTRTGCNSEADQGNIAPFYYVAMVVGASLVVIFVANCIMMLMIWLAVKNQTEKSQAYRYSWMTNTPQRTSEGQDNADASANDAASRARTWTSCCQSLFSSSLWTLIRTHLTRNRHQEERAEQQAVSSPLAARLSRHSQASIRRVKETSRRAFGYVIGFLLTYIFTFIQRTIVGFTSTPVPFAITFLASFFLPLQGFFNVLVYTYPHVLSYRRSHREYSWARSFWAVIKNGGDSDRNQVSSGGVRRRSSLVARRNQKKAQHSSKHSKVEGEVRFGGASSSDNESASATMVVPLSLSLAAGGDGNILDLMEKEQVRATDRCDACEDEEGSMQVISSKSGDLLFPISQDSDDDGMILSDVDYDVEG